MTPTLVIMIVLGVVLIAISLTTYRFGMKKHFDIISQFPYELMGKENRFSMATRLTFLLFLVTMLPWLFFQIDFASVSGTLSGMAWVILAAFGIFVVLFMMLTLTNPANEKAENVLFTLSNALLIISSGIEGFFVLKIQSMLGNENPSSIALIVMAVLCFAFALAGVALLINPKLKNWPRLDAVAETDGTVSYKRPRPFILALSEWLLLIISFAFTVVSSIALIIMSSI